jgi:hypothetical protein
VFWRDDEGYAEVSVGEPVIWMINRQLEKGPGPEGLAVLYCVHKRPTNVSKASAVPVASRLCQGDKAAAAVHGNNQISDRNQPSESTLLFDLLIDALFYFKRKFSSDE